MNTHPSFWWALLAWGLMSCRQAPPAGQLPGEFELPETWGVQDAAASSAPADAWWTAFGDPELNQLVDGVLLANPDLHAAAASRRQALAFADAAGAARWPSVSAGLQGARSRTNLIGLPIPGAGDVLTITNNQFDLAAEVAWELDLWGRIDAATDAAEADALAARLDFEAARLSLIGETVRAWLGRRETTRQVELARAQQQLAEQQLEILRTRFANGSVNASLVLAGEQVVIAWTGRVAQLELSLNQQVRGLQVLTGQYPSGEVDDALEEGFGLPALPPPVPTGVPAELLSRRPDLMAAEARVYAAAAREREARANLYPRLSLTASGGTSSNEVGDLLDGDFRVWGLAGGLTAPLFQGGRLRANVDASLAARERAVWQFVRTTLVAMAEVENALVTERTAREEWERLQRNERRARSQATLAEARYRAGSATVLEWLEQQSLALDAESARLAAERALLQTRTDLHLALGGGFSLSNDES